MKQTLNTITKIAISPAVIAFYIIALIFFILGSLLLYLVDWEEADCKELKSCK